MEGASPPFFVIGLLLHFALESTLFEDLGVLLGNLTGQRIEEQQDDGDEAIADRRCERGHAVDVVQRLGALRDGLSRSGGHIAGGCQHDCRQKTGQRLANLACEHIAGVHGAILTGVGLDLDVIDDIGDEAPDHKAEHAVAEHGQNGFDNGGISGVCKWAQLPEEVEFVLSVLERLAKRYGNREALMGIEIINEPNTTTSWPMMNVTERYKAVDAELAEGTGPIEFDWLKNFYITAYRRLRDVDKGALPTDKAVVFHDGFDIEQWKDFMRGADGKLASEFENVILDTHQYLMAAEMMGCPQTVEGYDDFVRNTYAPMVAEMSEYFPVIVGEWCLFNSVGCGVDTHGGQSVLNGEEGAQAETLSAEEKRALYQGVAKSQLEAWSNGSGFYYWNYKLLTDTVNTPGWIGWDAWDLGRCIAQSWFPLPPIL